MKALVDHLRIVKQHRMVFECFICKQHEAYSEKAMRNHIKRHKQPNIKRFRRICLICKIPLSVTNFDSHLCGNEKYVPCEYCSGRFTTTKRLREHLENVHKSNLQLHHCKKCTKYFPMVWLKNVHETVHNNETLLTCEACSKQFFHKSTFNNHKRSHEETKCK